jgi:RNA polymerase sigma factor FliA
MEAFRTDNDLMDKYVATHDPSLREEIILRYIPLIHFVLGRLGLSKYKSADYADFESQGLIGLIEAIDHYDPKYGAKLSTYATLKIRSKVLDYLREMDWLPRGARERVKAVQNGISELESRFQRTPSDDELANHLNMNKDTLQQALQDASHMVVSLDAVYDETDASDGTTLHEKLLDESQDNPSIEFENRDTQQYLVNTLKLLPEREKLVLSFYYYDELTFKEIGEVLNISESRVCQIHGRAVTSLKTQMQTKFTHANG